MTGGRPQRRVTDHFHPEMWTRPEQHRYEDGIEEDLRLIRVEVGKLANRITLMLGALGLIAFLLPIVAPFLRAIIGIEVPSDR